MLESNFSNFSNSTRPFILERGSKKYSCPNCGKKSLTELENLVQETGLTCGMDLSKYKLEED